MDRTLPYVNAYGTVDISNTNSVSEALELAELNWNVESKKLYDEYGNELPRYKGNFRDTDGELLGIVSDKYSIVQNIEAFSFVDSLVNEGFKFDSAGSFRNGRSIWVMGNLPQTSILGDVISNNIVFVNSHDGSSGVKVMMTPIRLICSNMLNLALKRADRIWATRHIGNINTKLEEAKYTLCLANKYTEELSIEAERLVNIKISDAEIEALFDSLFPIDRNKDSERKINNLTLMKNNFIQCYNAEDIKQFKNTAYGAINAFADFVDHKDPNRITNNYYENSWYRLINGDNNLDRFYKALM